MDIFLSVLIVRRFFFAARKAFSTATGVSAALPCPTPTTPLRLPATSVTEKLKRRPPATTRVTRLTETVLWSNSGLTLVSFLGLLLGFFLNSRPILPLGAFFSPPAVKTASGALFFVSSAGVFVSVCFSFFASAFFARIFPSPPAVLTPFFPEAALLVTATIVFPAVSSIIWAERYLFDLKTERRGRVKVPDTLARIRAFLLSLLICFFIFLFLMFLLRTVIHTKVEP